MKNFKQILSLIAEAKLEPGGEDVGKLFGPKGRFSPKSKDAPKEPTARERIKSGELKPNPDRPSGMEDLLSRFPPSEGPKEPTAKRQKVVLFTNNLHHDLIGTDNKTILAAMQEPNSKHPKFIEHSRKLTAAHAANIDSDSTQYSRKVSAHKTVDAHFADLTERIMGLSPDGVLPNNKKFGETKITQISTPKQEWPGTRSINIHFAPFKTYVSGSDELKTLTQYLYDQTGHGWYIHPNSGTYMVGTKKSPLILTTDINHPDLGTPGGDDGGGHMGTTPKPRMPALV